jgi:2-dehydropantoate 2-reductase
VSLLSTPEVKQLVLEIHREVFELATKILGPRPHYLDNYDEFLARTEKLNQLNGEYLPSMLLDYKNGKPLEIEAICGNPVRIAKRNGIQVPRLETIYQIIKKLADRS